MEKIRTLVKKHSRGLSKVQSSFQNNILWEESTKLNLFVFSEVGRKIFHVSGRKSTLLVTTSFYRSKNDILNKDIFHENQFFLFSMKNFCRVVETTIYVFKRTFCGKPTFDTFEHDRWQSTLTGKSSSDLKI